MDQERYAKQPGRIRRPKPFPKYLDFPKLKMAPKSNESDFLLLVC